MTPHPTPNRKLAAALLALFPGCSVTCLQVSALLHPSPLTLRAFSGFWNLLSLHYKPPSKQAP